MENIILLACIGSSLLVLAALVDVLINRWRLGRLEKRIRNQAEYRDIQKEGEELWQSRVSKDRDKEG